MASGGSGIFLRSGLDKNREKTPQRSKTQRPPSNLNLVRKRQAVQGIFQELQTTASITIKKTRMGVNGIRAPKRGRGGHQEILDYYTLSFGWVLLLRSLPLKQKKTALGRKPYRNGRDRNLPGCLNSQLAL